jgi:O-acetyl-ADP-ribose deacetylase (regulator of RNase III)
MVLLMRFATGNLLDAKAKALVNTVNAAGVMGKGIALMFKENSPRISACIKRHVRKGV